MQRIAAVLVGALAGCLSTPPPAVDPDVAAPCRDDDGDGWFTCGAYADCRDDDAAIHPGALEDLGAADRDCDGAEPTALLPTLTLAVAAGSHRVQTSTATYQLTDARGGQLGRLELGGVSWLYDGPILEQLSGVHTWTSSGVNDSRSVAATASTTTVELAGRGLVRARVDWTAHRITGHSRFTFHVDGRLIRTDDFVVTPAADNDGVTSFVAIDAGQVDELRWQDLAGTSRPTSTTMIGADASEFALAGNEGDDGFLCASSSSNELVWTATAAPILAGAGQPRRGLRATRNRTGTSGPTEQVALGFDWEFAPLSAGRRVAHAALWAGGSGATRCEAGIDRLRPLRQPTAVATRGGHAVDTIGDYDVMADGFVEDGGYWALRPTGGEVALRFVAPGLTGSWHLFHLATWTHDAVVLRQTAGGGRVRLIHGQDYLLDVDGDGSWLSLRDGLGEDTLIAIDPTASCPGC